MAALAPLAGACGGFDPQEGERSQNPDGRGVVSNGGIGAEPSTTIVSDGGSEAGGGDAGGRCVASCRLAVDAACRASCLSACGTPGCDVPTFAFEQVTAVRCTGTNAVEYYVLSQGKSCQVPGT